MPSRNLVELVRRHHAVDAPTVLDLLSAAADADGGLVTDDAVRDVAARTGVPEATVHGVATFYDDLLVPRGTRHVGVCTGTGSAGRSSPLMAGPMTNAERKNMSANAPRATAGAFQVPKRR